MTVAARGRESERRTLAARPTLGQRLRYKFRITVSEPTTLIGVLMAALFAYLIVVPIIAIVLDAARSSLATSAGSRPTSAT